MPNPFFADMVRELCHEGGTGPLTPTGAAPGHRCFADAVPADASFHYAVAGVTWPAEWECGIGHIDAAGRLVRDSVAASSDDGARVDFAPGLKTIALTVGADWFAGQTAPVDVADLTAALAGKQPLSTGHDAAANGADGDMVTVRRGADWVNIPLATLAYRDGAGRLIAGAPAACVDGSAAAPSIAFADDPGTGLYRPGANVLGVATDGIERMRITAGGHVGIGTTTPFVYGLNYRACHLAASAGAQMTLDGGACRGVLYSDISRGGGTTLGNETFHHLNFMTNGARYWRLEDIGHFLPLYDNLLSFGEGARRIAAIYLGTAPIVTSDIRMKAYRADPPPRVPELAAALACFDAFGFFQFDASIALKGPDGARWHYGPRAQALWDICAAHGLVEARGADGRPVAGSIPPAFLCWDRWDEDVEEQREAGDIFGVRIDQLHSLMLAALNGERKAQDARIAALAARIDALEAAA